MTSLIPALTALALLLAFTGDPAAIAAAVLLMVVAPIALKQ